MAVVVPAIIGGALAATGTAGAIGTALKGRTPQPVSYGQTSKGESPYITTSSPPEYVPPDMSIPGELTQLPPNAVPIRSWLGIAMPGYKLSDYRGPEGIFIDTTTGKPIKNSDGSYYTLPPNFAATEDGNIVDQRTGRTFKVDGNTGVISVQLPPPPTYNPIQVDLNQNRAESKDDLARGMSGLAAAAQTADAHNQAGWGYHNDAKTDNKAVESAYSREGLNTLQNYTPGAVSEAMSQQVLGQNARANLGAARSGGQLALRNALNANAHAGVTAAGDVAAQRALEEERYLKALVDQRELDRKAATEAEENREERIKRQEEQGMGFANDSLGRSIEAAGKYTSTASDREQAYLDAENEYYKRQMELAALYEKMLQEKDDKKRDRLLQTFSALISAGGNIAGKAFSLTTNDKGQTVVTNTATGEVISSSQPLTTTTVPTSTTPSTSSPVGVSAQPLVASTPAPTTQPTSAPTGYYDQPYIAGLPGPSTVPTPAAQPTSLPPAQSGLQAAMDTMREKKRREEALGTTSTARGTPIRG